jgi:thioredoxin reductase (NADPH)
MALDVALPTLAGGPLPPESQRTAVRQRAFRWGFVLTGPEVDQRWPLRRVPLLLETSPPGVFAVGDVRHGSVKRVASAVGEGSICIRLVHECLGSAC